MFTAEGLIEFHKRAHQSLKKLINHCGQFDDDELNRDIAGFGYSNLKLQLHHAIGAERYWISILLGRIDVDENESDYASIENLDRFRRETYLITEQYIRSASEDELNTARPMMTWGKQRENINSRSSIYAYPDSYFPSSRSNCGYVQIARQTY